MGVDPEYIIILDIRSSDFEMIFFAFVGINFVGSIVTSFQSSCQMRQGNRENNRDSQREMLFALELHLRTRDTVCHCALHPPTKRWRYLFENLASIQCVYREQICL